MPIFLKKLHGWLSVKFSRLTGANILITLALYLVACWCLLWLAGEPDLTQLPNFFYFIAVTGSTVGYGDFSPQTDFGKWVVSLFVIPGGVGLFALIIGRVASNLIYMWKLRLLGKSKVNTENHLIILGWHEQRTPHLLDMLLHEIDTKEQAIVLCTTIEMENPFPGKIEFVHVNEFTDNNSMTKASLDKAKTIIIDLDDDNAIMSCGLFCSSLNPNAHIVTYFKNHKLATLLQDHCKNVECIPTLASEMVAKSAVDPGSSKLHYELVNNSLGMTQYTVKYTGEDISFATLFHSMKTDHDAILIAINAEGVMKLNPTLNSTIHNNDELIYIADERVTDFEWA